MQVLMQVNISTSEQSIQENLSHLLERLSGCGNPKVSSLKLFWEETKGGVLLILLGDDDDHDDDGDHDEFRRLPFRGDFSARNKLL